MADVLGHVAMGMLWAVPAWFLWHRRVAVPFVGTVLLTVMVPDVDKYAPGIPHHGITHTVVFVTAVALVGGVLVTAVAKPALRRWYPAENELASWGSLYAFVAVALLLGGLSHLFADLISAGTAGNPPVEPFWPFFRKPFSVDWFHFSSFRLNGALLIVALAIHLVLYAIDVSPFEHRYRIHVE